MFEVEKATISVAAYNVIAIPVAGSIGALFAGWSSDRFFQSRRAPIMVITLVLLMTVTALYPSLGRFHWIWSLIRLIGIGFATYGPNVMICATISMDYASRKAAPSVAGLIDRCGYIGASLTGIFTGYFVDNYGRNYGFYFWISGALISTLFMSFLWNYEPQKGKYH